MWYAIGNVESIVTPALAIYPERILENISRMKAIAGSVDRLCPHVKTHKMAKVTAMYILADVKQFKCATMAELEMVAGSGAEFALLAIQPVGPNIQRLLALAANFRDVEIGTIVDSQVIVDQLAEEAAQRNVQLTVLIDIDAGMGRTGAVAGQYAEDLYRRIDSASHLRAGGLHVYDGHIHDTDLADRRARVEQAAEPALALRDRLLASGHSVSRFITGGTATFPIHAEHADRICSPGTPIFWDAGYGSNFPDLPFLPAAVLLTRVISKLDQHRVCLDLGYKAIAGEMPHPRSQFLNIENVREVLQSEEHLVVEANTSSLQVGDLLYAIPRHICPTVALHEQAWVVQNGTAIETWPVTARSRQLSF